MGQKATGGAVGVGLIRLQYQESQLESPPKAHWRSHFIISGQWAIVTDPYDMTVIPCYATYTFSNVSAYPWNTEEPEWLSDTKLICVWEIYNERRRKFRSTWIFGRDGGQSEDSRTAHTRWEGRVFPLSTGLVEITKPFRYYCRQLTPVDSHGPELLFDWHYPHVIHLCISIDPSTGHFDTSLTVSVQQNVLHRHHETIGRFSGCQTQVPWIWFPDRVCLYCVRRWGGSN